MEPLQVLSASEQVARHLREHLLRGTWHGTIPGEDRLVARLGVGRDTVKAALVLLERDGLLVSQGPGRRRLVNLPEDAMAPGMRVGILSFDADSWTDPLLMEVHNHLIKAGFSIHRSPKSLLQLGMKGARVERIVNRMEVDAWLVLAGSQEVLEWFASREIPVLALFGRFRGLPIAAAGLDKEQVYRDIVRRLVALGHRRIVMVAREERRKPVPGKAERAFLDELVACGIEPSAYHLPHWDPTPDGYGEWLAGLFRYSAPTAMIIQLPGLLVATLQHLSSMGMCAPGDVSLISGDDDSAFDWCSPAIGRITADKSRIAKRVLRWVSNLSKGRADQHQSLFKAHFVEAGTVSVAKRRGA